MCGIVGVVGRNPASPLLVEALRRLEYRGYDSAGIATLVNGHIERRRAEGKLARLAALLDQRPLPGTTGIGHTRWATHGRPSETNAHPIATDRVAVVHNGIIENHAELKARLAAAGATFETETDTETVARLLDRDLAAGATPEEAMAATLKRIEGAFALAVLFAGRHDMIMAARRGSPLAIGYGDGEMYVGSDALALAPLTERISYLEEGDWAIVTQQGAEIFDHADRPVVRPIRRTAVSGAMVGKGNFRHFMQKEIPTCRSTSRASRASRSAPAAPRSLPARGRATGSSRSRACPPRPRSPRSSATASRCSIRARSCSASASPARRSTPLPRCAGPRARTSACSRW